MVLGPRRRKERAVLLLQSFSFSKWDFCWNPLRWAASVVTVTERARPHHLRRVQLRPLERIHERHASLKSRQGVEEFQSIPPQHPLSVDAQLCSIPSGHESIAVLVWASGEVTKTGESQSPWHQRKGAEIY